MQTTKKSAPKRLLGMILTLCMALALVPAFPLTASAAAPANPAAGTTWDFTAVDADGSDTYGGGTWSWVQSTRTLTLAGVTHSTAAAPALLVPHNTTIVLSGTSTITSTYSSAGYAPGLAFEGGGSGGEATISGSGTLIVTGGDSTDGLSCGIYA